MMIKKELIPNFSYPDDEGYFYNSLDPVTTQEINGHYFNLIDLNNIWDFFEYFIKDKGALKEYIEKFLLENISQSSLVKAFFQNESGWHVTSFNSITGKFNGTELGCGELLFCRDSFLKSVIFTDLYKTLYKNLDTTAFLKAVKIRRDYDYFAEDALDLKYYLETGMDLRSSESTTKSTKTNQINGTIKITYDSVNNKIIIFYEELRAEHKITKHHEIFEQLFNSPNNWIDFTNAGQFLENLVTKHLKDKIKKKLSLDVDCRNFFDITKANKIKLKRTEISI